MTSVPCFILHPPERILLRENPRVVVVTVVVVVLAGGNVRLRLEVKTAAVGIIT